MKKNKRQTYIALTEASGICNLCSFCRYGYWNNWGCEFKSDGPYCENDLNRRYEFIDPKDVFPGDDCWLFSPRKGGLSAAADVAGFWMRAEAAGLLGYTYENR